MKKIYCDVCKCEIMPEDPHYVARFERNKKWRNDKDRSIDICNACHNVLMDSERAMEEVSCCDFESLPFDSDVEKEDDVNGLGEQTRGESEA